MKKKRLTKKERMSKLLQEKIAQFKQDLANDQAALQRNVEYITSTQEANKELEERIKQLQEVITKLSK